MNDQTHDRASSPFSGASGFGLSLRLTITGLLVLGAAVSAFLLTRGTNEPTSAAAHVHSAAGATTGKPVMLSADQARRIGVTFANVTLSPLESEVRTVAQVTYDETRLTVVAPKIDGWIERLMVNFTGQAVRAGQPLLTIYSPMFVAAEQELLLASRLAKDVANGSDETRASALSLLEAARKRLLYWDITPADIERIERTGEIVKDVVLRTPVSGVVVEKSVLPGQRIMGGEALYKIADLSVVWVEGEVFERDLPAMHVGQIVIAEFQALPGTTRTGRISYIYPTIDPETRTARVRVALSNPNLSLKPGMYATIRARSLGSTPVISVPRSAVLSTGERNLVFVRRPDAMLEPREVQLGVATDERVQVIAGLQAGETVVASATFLLDAESNLGSLLGGMGDMPGMDMTKPTQRPAPTAPKTVPPE